MAIGEANGKSNTLKKLVFIWPFLFDTLRLPCRVFREFRPMQVLFFPPFVQPPPAALK